jgi:hypothetical protein
MTHPRDGCVAIEKKLCLSRVKVATRVAPAFYLDISTLKSCLANRWLPQTTCANCARCSGDLLPPSRPAEKAKKPWPPARESSAEQTRLEFFYRSQFHSTVSNLCRLQPARYITTAHSSLCSETMSLRGRGKTALLRCLRSSGRHEPLGGSGHYEMPTEFQTLRDTTWRRISWS